MEVSTLLNLMGNLSLGNDNITEVERGIFLQYGSIQATVSH